MAAVILEPKKIKSVIVSIVSPSICPEVMGPDAMIFGQEPKNVGRFLKPDEASKEILSWSLQMERVLHLNVSPMGPILSFWSPEL